MARRLVLLGDPVEHSISPAIHECAFARLGIDASYEVRRTTVAELPAAVRAAADGGNVTLPHKERVAALLDERTPAVEATGACNCFWLGRDSGLTGDNTDVGGFLASLETLGLTSLTGASVLLLGAGGGARAVLYGCVERQAARVHVWNRNTARAEAMVEAVAPQSTVRVLARLEEGVHPYDLVVHATSLGLHPSDRIPAAWRELRPGSAIDLVYAPGGTAWTRTMTASGIPAIDGLEMLVQQAALSLRTWFPGSEPPLDAMRVAARDALRGRHHGSSPCA